MHRDFDAARRAYSAHVPRVEFTLGGERFEVLADPTLGDVFEMADVPDIAPDDFDPGNPGHMKLVRGLCKFIERMLPIEDRARWSDLVLFRVPVSHYVVILDIGNYITDQVINRPTVPPASSSSGRRTTGRNTRKRRVGANASS